MYRIKCAEVWGGSRAIDTDVCTGGLTASLFSRASGDDENGGDVYYFSVCSHDQLSRIVLADVVGHGVAVEHISHWLYETMLERFEMLEGRLVLEDLNRTVCERGLEAMTTAAVITFYAEDSGLSFSYAGHPPLLMCRRDESEWRAMNAAQSGNPSNLPLGILSDTIYDEEKIRLGAGDRLLLYTDGVTETMNATGELFGDVRLLKVLAESGAGSLSEIKRAVRAATLAHANDATSEHDDFTLIAVEVN